MEAHQFDYYQEFPLESGEALPGLRLAWHTAGELNPAHDNVIWVCHALTANSDVSEWWPGMVGPGKTFDTNTHFVICANILGSPYGATHPLSTNPETGQPWYRGFPTITIRDMVAAHEILRKHLGITGIDLLVGGSIGGFQALEWAIQQPELIANLALLATNAESSPWAIAFNESQRLAIQADASFYENIPEGGKNGLKAARAMALLSYRNGQTYNRTQATPHEGLGEVFPAATYQQYQGKKLVQRFDAYSYTTILHAMDSHHAGRGRDSTAKALQRVKARTLLIAISSDMLFPPNEMQWMQQHLPRARYEEIDSTYGHDGFLVETDAISTIIKQFKRTHEQAA